MGKFEKPKNPALNYVSKDEPEKIEPAGINLEGKEIIYITVAPETKSKRKGLLLYPSVHNKILELSKKEDVSFNDFVNQILKEYVERNK